jgi:hypothetical protein
LQWILLRLGGRFAILHRSGLCTDCGNLNGSLRRITKR